MKKQFSLLLAAVMVLNPLTSAFADISVDVGGRVTEAKDFNYEYNDHMYKSSHVLRVTDGRLVSTSEQLPSTTEEAHVLFEDVCAPRSSTQDLNKKLTVTYKGFLKTSTFECEKRLENNDVSTVQFVVTTDRDERLKDLQINELKTNAKSESLDPHKLTVKDAAEVAVAVAASTLVSGLLAKQIYAGEQDKFLHATTGSLIAATATLFSYYGLKLSKNQAAIIGFATAVAVALLKEYAYDARNRDSHTVDIRDAQATALGGGVGTFFIRLKFEF